METLTTKKSTTGNTLLVAAGIAAAGTLLSAKSARAVSPALTFADIPGTGDIKVLNYALALEALEADLYAQALLRLTGGGTNAVGKTIPGLNIADSQPDVTYTRNFGEIEAQHRDFLNAALGSSAIIAPGMPLENAKFDFGIETMTRQQVVLLLHTVEALGTRAYLGAIPEFATKDYLAVAGGIQATEARHTAAIAIVANQLFNAGLNTAPLADDNHGIDTPASPNEVLATASPFIVLS